MTAPHPVATQSDQARPHDPLLKITDLRTYFYTDEGVVRAVDGVSMAMGRRETLGVVGESGCGKSVMAFSAMRLIPSPPGKIEGGEILFYRDRGSPAGRPDDPEARPAQKSEAFAATISR